MYLPQLLKLQYFFNLFVDKFILFLIFTIVNLNYLLFYEI